MLSVPLVWHDDVVGVLNVQTRERRRFRPDEIEFLTTIAALLAGIVEKGRLTAEIEARLAELTALDAARAELLSVVTHELRTPLSVVRVYVDLLAEAALGDGPLAPVPAWRDAAADQLGAARSARGLDPGLGPRRWADRTGPGAVRRRPGGRRDGRDAAPAAAPASHPLGAARAGRSPRSATSRASGRSSSSSSRTSRSTPPATRA